MFVRLKVKCLKCFLHFVIYTTSPQQHPKTAISCPQCAQRSGEYLIWAETIQGNISDDVPGKASPLA
jgi:hypothetical protein